MADTTLSLCVRHCSTGWWVLACRSCSLSLNADTVIKIPPLYRRGNWSTGRSHNLPRLGKQWVAESGLAPGCLTSRSVRAVLSSTVVVWLLCCVWFFWDPVDYSLPGSSVHGVLQARMLELVVISFSRGSSWPRDWTRISYVSCIGRWVLYPLMPLGKPQSEWERKGVTIAYFPNQWDPFGR